MDRFLRGHTEFRRAYAAAEREFLARLAREPQAPEALFVGCSDSRVIPELLTGAAPGQLFVVRNIANLVPPPDRVLISVGAAVEYALSVLGVKHAVVCGHYGCGGVQAMVEGLPPGVHLPALERWLAEPARAREATGDDPEARLRSAVELNVLEQLGNLASWPEVGERLAAGTLALHGWVYDMAKGHVSVYDADAERFVDAESMLG